MPRSDDTINRAFIPKGTGIGGSAFGLIRNVKAWEENAKLFRPERWLEGSAEELPEKAFELGNGHPLQKIPVFGPKRCSYGY